MQDNKSYLNPFVPSAPFLYLLKTSEKRKIFWCFQGVEERCIWKEWVKMMIKTNRNIHGCFDYEKTTTLLYNSSLH